MTKINDKYFDFETVDSCFDNLLKVQGIDEFTMSKEACKEIGGLLGFESKNEMGLRAVRNSVVKRFGTIICEILNIDSEGNMASNYSLTEEQAKERFSRYQKYNTYMSAIVGAIDNELYDRGFSV